MIRSSAITTRSLLVFSSTTPATPTTFQPALLQLLDASTPTSASPLTVSILPSSAAWTLSHPLLSHPQSQPLSTPTEQSVSSELISLFLELLYSQYAMEWLVVLLFFLSTHRPVTNRYFSFPREMMQRVSNYYIVFCPSLWRPYSDDVSAAYRIFGMHSRGSYSTAVSLTNTLHGAHKSMSCTLSHDGTVHVPCDLNMIIRTSPVIEHDAFRTAVYKGFG